MFFESLLFDLPSVEDVLASKLEYQLIKEKADEKARLVQVKKDTLYAKAYLDIMKKAIIEAIDELKSSLPDKTFTSLKMSHLDKLKIETDDGNTEQKTYFFEVHRGENEVYNVYTGKYTSTPNPIFASLFKDLQKVMEQKGYYLTDDSGYEIFKNSLGMININLRLKKPE